MKLTRLAILGATGSIGRQALEVAAAHRDRLRVVALGSGSDADELARLAAAHGVARTACAATDGDGALAELAASPDVDLVLVATPGIAGLRPTLAALEAGKAVALANKEVLVVAGHLVRERSGGAGERLRPVDSEHSALWQCLAGRRTEDVRRICLTASGGPFRDLPLGEFGAITPDRALRHPTWRMGPKVTVDSATLVNKAYEVIEARWLYDVPYDRIDVVLHPESVVHAMVELVDGSVLAQLAEPDMRLPIQYALLWEHAPGPAPRLDWRRARALTFRPVEAGRYPCLELILDSARADDLGALVGLSAADEVAVARFLAGDLRFTGIAELLGAGARIGSAARIGPRPDLATIEELDASVRSVLEQRAVPAATVS